METLIVGLSFISINIEYTFMHQTSIMNYTNSNLYKHLEKSKYRQNFIKYILKEATSIS